MYADEKVMEAMRWLVRREYEDRRVAEHQAEERGRRNTRLAQREHMYVAYLRDHDITVEQVEEHWRSKGYAVPS